jgi:thiamine biosynthesis lipoprotein
MPRSPVKILAWLLALALSLSLAGCGQTTQTFTFYTFGTQISVVIAGVSSHQAAQAEKAIEARFAQLHTDWHAWEKGGLLSKINEAIAKGEAIQVNNEVKNLITQAGEAEQKSLGYFNPAIGQLIALWGFHQHLWQGPPPSESQLQSYLEHPPSLSQIHFTGKDGLTLSASNPLIKIDMGGFAKGYALNLAIEILRKAGIENAIVNAGGDLRAIGSKRGQPWRIGIQDPKNTHQALAEIDVQGDESVFTSGGYERFYDHAGKTYTHIIDPQTGQSVTHTESVTVIHSDALWADAAATALYVAGSERWQEVAQSMKLTEVLLIDAQGEWHMTPAMRARLHRESH